MKSIRTADGLVANLRMMLDAPGDYINYWGSKEPGQYDTAPRGDRWGHLLGAEGILPVRPVGGFQSLDMSNADVPISPTSTSTPSRRRSRSVG